MSDPIEIVTSELKVQREVSAPTDSATAAGAFLVLNALHEEGWRIVRLDEPETFNPPPDYVWTRANGDPKDFDRSGVFYGDEDRPEGCVPLYRIAEEWTP